MENLNLKIQANIWDDKGNKNTVYWSWLGCLSFLVILENFHKSDGDEPWRTMKTKNL